MSVWLFWAVVFDATPEGVSVQEKPPTALSLDVESVTVATELEMVRPSRELR